MLCVGMFGIEVFRNLLNCESYIETNFFKFLLFHGKGTMHVTAPVFGLIPLQDFSKAWTDEELYKKYRLTQYEIDFIESMFDSTDLGGDD